MAEGGRAKIGVELGMKWSNAGHENFRTFSALQCKHNRSQSLIFPCSADS